MARGTRQLAGVGAPAPLPHRVHRWTGGGWFRRRVWVRHMPVWRSVAWDGRGRSVQVCDGDRECPVTRVAERAAMPW
jgi:hypothetical protein